MSTFGYEHICLNWIIYLKEGKMSCTLDGKIRIQARLSNTYYMRLHSWTSVTLRRLYIDQFLSLHFKNRNEDFLSKGSKDILHDNKILSCTMELPNESASFVVIFVLFSFGTNLWLHVLTKNTRKAFIHMTKINCLVTTLCEVFNKLKAFFFPFLGINEGIKRKQILHALVADQSTGFLARSRVPPQHINSREIGRTCQQKWKIQHQNHDDYDFFDHVWKRNLVNDTTNYSGFLNALEHQSTSLRNLTRLSSTVNKF